MPYEDEAGPYSKALYEGPIEMSSFFTIGEGDNEKDIFADAEPYHYGPKAPTGNYFIPLGDDGDPNTADYLIQIPDNNRYSAIIPVSGFSVGSQPEESLQYIQKGTFPMCGKGNGRLK